MLKEIIQLRQEIHQYPEISNNEHHTSERIIRFVQKFKPDEIIPLGETGVAFAFHGKEQGKTIIFRAELDALPIQEKTGLRYASVHKQVAHLCGHDGHMAILVGLMQKIAENRPGKGSAILLFQPAEEVEQGALEIVKNPKFIALRPDHLFALHNVPGFAKHQIILKNGSFAAASKGMTIQLTGKTSHAAEPQDGVSPAKAIADLIKRLHALRDHPTLFKDFILLTIIHIRMGEISFGTSPGYAELCLTLRAFQNEDMVLLTDQCEKIIQEIAQVERLECAIHYSEVFPATVNTEACVHFVQEAAMSLNLDVKIKDQPFKWSEDFGYFSEKYNSCYFGLGAGADHPQLHNPEYDFPDEILETGINMFYAIYKKTLCNDE